MKDIGLGYFVLLSYFFADSDPELVNGTLRTLDKAGIRYCN